MREERMHQRMREERMHQRMREEKKEVSDLCGLLVALEDF
jgi:hypothetical protein